MNKLCNQSAQRMEEAKFDKKIEELAIQHNLIKNNYAKDHDTDKSIKELLALKQELLPLTTKPQDANRKLTKKNFLISIEEQIIFGYLKQQKVSQAMKVITELEGAQDIVKEKNVKVIMYKARCYLLLKNLEKARENFLIAHSIVDDAKIKADINECLLPIEEAITSRKGEAKVDELDESIEAQVSQLKKFKYESETNSVVSSSKFDKDLILLDDSKTTDIENDDMMKIKQQAEAVCSASKIIKSGVIKISILKSATAILGEFMTKYDSTNPVYDLDKEVVEANKKIFTMSCYCLGHTEKGTDTNKKKAKEEASKKMLSHLKSIGKLELTEDGDKY